MIVTPPASSGDFIRSARRYVALVSFGERMVTFLPSSLRRTFTPLEGPLSCTTGAKRPKTICVSASFMGEGGGNSVWSAIFANPKKSFSVGLATSSTSGMLTVWPIRGLVKRSITPGVPDSEGNSFSSFKRFSLTASATIFRSEAGTSKVRGRFSEGRAEVASNGIT